MSAEKRRTKRRFAHELYPHAGEWESRPLDVEVPYRYARAVGLEVFGTDWGDLHSSGKRENHRLAADRTLLMIEARQVALMADAMLQGLTGDEAWAWANERACEESGEWIYERAQHYGVPTDQIRPYYVLSEPDHHSHYEEPDTRGWRTVITVASKELECAECTEDDS